jgi:hypothetical protein
LSYPSFHSSLCSGSNPGSGSDFSLEI